MQIHDVQLLSADWAVLKKTSFSWLRRDGTWQRQHRETYDRGNGATILLFNPASRSVVLTRQFRFPAFVNGHDGLLIETPAGLLDDASPEERIRAEVEEETGYRITRVTKLFEAFMSPGSVTEKLHFFTAEYEPTMKASAGGGNAGEAEDIEVLEVGLDDALRMITRGDIQDGKTIMLLQHAALHLLAARDTQHAST